MVRRRRVLKRKVGKKGKRRRKRRRKRVPKGVRKIRSAITGAKKVLIHNLGFDPQKEKPADFVPVIPDMYVTALMILNKITFIDPAYLIVRKVKIYPSVLSNLLVINLLHLKIY